MSLAFRRTAVWSGNLIISILLTLPSNGQSTAPAQLAQQKDANSTPPSGIPTSAPPSLKQGIPLTAGTVNDNVRVQAALLPYDVARRAFGKEIAEKYASIELVISNKSSDASFILHDIFLDYRQWGLSGIVSGPNGNIQAHVPAGPQSGLESTQTSTLPGQVACTEYRIVRAEMQDAQQWSARNWTVRSFVLVGSILSGISFTASEDWAKGISAFNGTVVPGVPVLWPDGAIQHLNTISDVGFRTNKVFPRQASDVVVCYYPINRFLPPGFIGIFKHSPALFFNPLSVLLDLRAFDKAKKVVRGLKPVSSTDIQQVMKHPEVLTSNVIPSAAPIQQNPSGGSSAGIQKTGSVQDQATALGISPDSLATMKLLQTVSLNNIHLIVDGIMTIDVNLVPGQITAIQCDDKGDPATFWSAAGQKKCRVEGRYLATGEVEITDADKLAISEIKTDTGSSTDRSLTFTFQLNKPVPSQAVLEFKVVKPEKDDSGVPTGRNIASMSFLLPVSYSLPPPSVDGVKEDDKGIVTVIGNNFFDIAGNKLAVSVRPIAAKDNKSDAAINSFTDRSTLPTSFTFDPAANKVPNGCYFVVVTTGANQPSISNEKNQVKVPVNNDCGSAAKGAGSNSAGATTETNAKNVKKDRRGPR